MSVKDFIEENFNKINIDRKIFNELWNIIENSDWLYVSDEMVENMFGYKKIKI